MTTPDKPESPRRVRRHLAETLEQFRQFVQECQTCQTEALADWQFCAHCGARLATRCPGCGRPLPPSGARFCPHCGVEIPKPETAAP